MKRTLQEEQKRFHQMINEYDFEFINKEHRDCARIIDEKIKSIVNNIFNNFGNLTRQQASDMIKKLLEPEDLNKQTSVQETGKEPRLLRDIPDDGTNNISKGFKPPMEMDEGQCIYSRSA